MVKPDDLKTKRGITYHIFRTGVQPIWEDKSNIDGGSWTLRLRKGGASRVWEDLVLAVIGGDFGVDDEVCGVKISMKPGEDKITVWHKSGNDKRKINFIRNKMRDVLKVPSLEAFDYKVHSGKILHITNSNNNRQGKHYHSHRTRKNSYKRRERQQNHNGFSQQSHQQSREEKEQ
jgi:hypothetical protein